MKTTLTPSRRLVPAALLTTVAAALAACGGGGADSATGSRASGSEPPSATATPDTTPPNVTRLAGVAATGAPMARARIVIRDADPATPDVTTQADDEGAYVADVTGSKAPLVVEATGTVLGEESRFKAVVPELAPAASNVANVTPLTHAVTALLAPDGDPDTLADAAAIARHVTATVVRDAVRTLVATLAADPTTRTYLADGAGGDAARFDPMRTPFVASAADPIDRMLDRIRVRVTASGVLLTNVTAVAGESAESQQSPTVTLTRAHLAAPEQAPALPASARTTLPTVADLKAIADAFGACFAMPPSGRATLAADGSVASLHPACDALAADGYLNGGYTWKEDIARWIVDPLLTGARFSPPSIALAVPPAGHPTGGKVLVHPYCNAADCAVVMLGARQVNGAARGMYLTLARTGPERGRAVWRSVGNGRKYDVTVEPHVARLVAINSAAEKTSAYGGRSRIEARVRIRLSPLGPNARDVRLVRATPLGEPMFNGIVLSRSRNCNLSYRFTLDNRNGRLTDPNGTPLFVNFAGAPDVTYDAVLIDPVTGAVLDEPVAWPNGPRPDRNPDAQQAFTTSKVAADAPLMPAWASWRIEIFKFGSPDPLVADEVLFVRTPHALMRAADAARLGWAAPMPGFIDRYLRPTGEFAAPATPLTSVTMSWTQPEGAPVYENAWLFSSAVVPVGDANPIPVRRSMLFGEAPGSGQSSVVGIAGSGPASRQESGIGTAPDIANLPSWAINPHCPPDRMPTDHSLTPLTTHPSAYREIGFSNRPWSGVPQFSTYFWTN